MWVKKEETEGKISEESYDEIYQESEKNIAEAPDRLSMHTSMHKRSKFSVSVISDGVH